MRISRVAVILFSCIVLLTLLASAALAQSPEGSEIEKYMVIAMGSEVALDFANTELGANREALSTDVGGTPWANSTPNLLSVFGERWDTSEKPHHLVPGALVVEAIEYSGNIALTSDGGQFTASTSVLFADLGIKGASGTPIDGVDAVTSYYAPFDVTPVPNSLVVGNGVSTGVDFSTLLSQLDAWKTFIDGLPADRTITDVTVFSNHPATDGVLADGMLRVLTDTIPSDGFIVVDIAVGPPGCEDTTPVTCDDFELNNTDLVIHSLGGEPIIYRILGGSNMKMSDSSVLMHSDNFTPPDRYLGAIFYQASEPAESTDTVFTIGNDTVLNGIGVWDLNTVGDDGPKTIINVQNGQGCSQFISQRVNFSNGRWARCVQSPTALALGPLEIQPDSGPNAAMVIGVGLLLAASAVIAISRIRRSET